MADDEIEPERKYYTLKPKSFERVNRPTHEEPRGAIDVQAMLQQNLAADARRAAPQADANNALPSAAPPNETSAPARPAATSNDAKPPVLPVATFRPRRKKDYLITLLCAAVVFGVPAIFLRQSEFAVIALGSAFALFAMVMAWIFWGIMDRY